jgi:outer membrane protein TolC
MNVIWRLVIVFFSFSSLCVADDANIIVPASVVSLSLNDAVLMTIENNKDIKIQEEEINVANSQITGAKSQFLPKFGVSAGYTYNDAILPIPQQFAQGEDKDIGVFTGYNNDNQVNLSLSEQIYNGGASYANLKQAELRLKIQKETLRAKKQYAEFETKRLYYGLLLAYETERITEDLLNQAQSHYEDVKKKYEQGTASRFDVLQSKVQVSKVLPQVVKAKNAIDLIETDLKKILGLKMKDSIMLKEKLDYSLIEIKEDDFLQTAYSCNPEMILKSFGVDMGQWAIKMAKAGWLPQVDAGVGYMFRSDSWGDMFNARHSNWNAGIKVSMSIFDGFSTKAKVEEAKARYLQAGLAEEDFNDQIAVSIRRGCLDLKEAKAIIDSQKDNIEEAKEALRISEISYDNGEGTNLDILDAQVSLSQIEKNLSEGVYDYLMAKAYLDRTMGVDFIVQISENQRKN